MEPVFIVILCALLFAAGWLFGTRRAGKALGKSIDAERAQKEKFRYSMYVYDVWMMTKKYGRPLEEELLRRGVRRVVIYGMAEFGVRLYHELKDGPIEVLYTLDRRPSLHIPGVPAYAWGREEPPEDAKRSADAVIVSAFPFFDSVKPELEGAGYRNVIALDSLLFDLMGEE